jgi:hypothetical protein
MTSKPTPDGPITDETIERQHAAAGRAHDAARLALPSNHDALQVQYDHTHDTAGGFIALGITQDAAEPACLGCGRRIPRGERPHAHAIGCTHYAPHPDSIAAQRPTSN